MNPESHRSERRIHKVYVTRNTEYHLRRDECIAVRDRRTGHWLEAHAAVRKNLGGSVYFHTNGICPTAGGPRVGDSIYFRNGERDLITSRVESIERPEKHIVLQYRW